MDFRSLLVSSCALGPRTTSLSATPLLCHFWVLPSSPQPFRLRGRPEVQVSGTATTVTGRTGPSGVSVNPSSTVGPTVVVSTHPGPLGVRDRISSLRRVRSRMEGRLRTGSKSRGGMFPGPIVKGVETMESHVPIPKGRSPGFRTTRVEVSDGVERRDFSPCLLLSRLPCECM